VDCLVNLIQALFLDIVQLKACVSSKIVSSFDIFCSLFIAMFFINLL